MQGKTALITGGMGGIGTSIVEKLSSLGVKVAVTFNRDPAKAQLWLEVQKQTGRDITISQADLSQLDSTVKMVEDVLSKLGRIDILVNNAGITEDATLAKMTHEQWIKVINTNLNSIFNVTKHVLPSMIDNKYGRIINISSVNAQKGQFGQTNYATAKAGIHGFTKSLAYEVAKKGITVNTISPGYVKTGMMDKIAPEILDKIIQQIPVGRLATPEEIADVVSFLAAETTGYVTGANWSINGGLHMY